MNNYLEIYFKENVYKIDSILDYQSEHCKLNEFNHIYTIVTDNVPNGFLKEAGDRLPVKVNIFGDFIWRPQISVKTKLNLETKKQQYTITISVKGD